MLLSWSILPKFGNGSVFTPPTFRGWLMFVTIFSFRPSLPTYPTWNTGIAQAPLNLQAEVVEVRRAEVLVHGIGTQAEGARCAIGVAAYLNSRKDRCTSRLRLSRPVAPVVTAPAVGGNGEAGITKRVALDTLRCGDGRAEVQEWVQVDLIVEDTNSAAYDEIALRCRLIGESDSRGKVVPVRRKDGIETRSLDGKSPSRNEVGDVFSITMERPEIFVAHTIIQIELPGNLPAILEIQVVGVYHDKAFRISDCNGRA